MRQIKISLPNRFCRRSRRILPLYMAPCRNASLSAVHRLGCSGSRQPVDKRDDICGWHSRMRKAAMTVEAAAALPLFFLAVVSLICMMDLYGTYAEKVVKLQEQAETAGAWVSVTGERGPSVIDLPLGFTYRPQWYPEALPAVRIAVRGRVHAWNGRDPADNAENPEETEQEELVYVTEYESVFHTTSECTHLALSVQAVGRSRVDALRNQEGKAYHACEKCARYGTKNGTVYITREGNRFHNDAACSGLTRSVRLVKKSEVEGLHVCSRCQQLEKAA